MRSAGLAVAAFAYSLEPIIMDFLRFANWGILSETGFTDRAVMAPSLRDDEDLSTVLQVAHLRRDIARRPDLTPFVRDERGEAA